MKTTILCVAAVALVALPACDSKSSGAKGSTAAEAKKSFGEMSLDDVEKGVAKKDGKFFVYDNNSEEVFAKGHVPGAKWVKFDEVKASDLPADKAATLVFYCANEQCTACHTAADTALELGYTNVFIMPAGIRGWQKAGKKVDPPGPAGV